MSMNADMDRRQILIGALAGTTLILPGCASLGGFGLTDAIRRILTLSSQNAFAQLLLPGGFYDNSVSRIALPARFGGSNGGGILSVVLQSAAFRNTLQKQLNRAAEKGAERAAPLVADAVRNVGIEDAAAIVGGGPQAATAFLRGKMGTALISAMLPGVGEGLRLFDDAVIGKAVQSVSGYDIGGLANDLTNAVDNSIWASIGAQEADIRANPQKTNDPVLIGVFGLAK
jgi:hypothetical protein